MPNIAKILLNSFRGKHSDHRDAAPRVPEYAGAGASAIVIRDVSVAEKLQNIREVLDDCNAHVRIMDLLAFGAVKMSVEELPDDEIARLFRAKISKMEKKPKTEDDKYRMRADLYDTTAIDERINRFFN